ncbi:unnamed protein product [Cladocopium goreaui]|uniref:Uncharacterized protein n=1 Tax=Cladocopium goreaui TaxID=2562237 RepID=A0A9P1DY83_9DINO|nr:unnamed protein product [Cladocopium goreaui]
MASSGPARRTTTTSTPFGRRLRTWRTSPLQDAAFGRCHRQRPFDVSRSVAIRQP